MGAGYDEATVTINVTNTGPVANADSYTLTQDTTLNIAAPSGVLANDSDADGDDLNLILGDTDNANGTVTLNTDGSFSYTPDAGFVGIATFDYIIDDGIDYDEAVVTLNVLSSGPNIATGTVSGVTDTWTTVNLATPYADMVVVATPNYAAGHEPVVTRIRNVTATSFELRVQRADDNTAAATPTDVHYVVAEAGVYTQAEHGITLEAFKHSSTQTARKNAWNNMDSIAYANTYTAPVVVGQVMSSNDSRWSTFFSTGASQNAPASASDLRIGKHVGEDTDTTRLAETLGVIVVESGTGSVDGLAYEAGLGTDSVRGISNGSYTYDPDFTGQTSGILSMSGVDGGDGGWAVLEGDPFRDGMINLVIDEDQIGDNERSHTTEQVAFLVFSPLSGEVDPYLDGQVAAIAFHGGDATDYSPLGQDNSGTLVDGATVVDDPGYGKALSPNGGRVVIPDSADINLGTHTQRTIGLRFKTNDVSGRQVLYEEGGATRGLNIYIDNGTLYVGGWNTPSGESGWSGTYLQQAITADGSWHHVALTLDGGTTVSPGAMQLYFDGSLVATGAGSQLWSHGDDTALGAIAGKTLFHDGTTGSNGSNGFTGLLDSLLIYRRVVPMNEIIYLT